MIAEKNVPEIWNVADWDEQLEAEGRAQADAAWREMVESSQREREMQNAEWWSQYTAYLLTPEWRSKADRVLARDAWVCQACLRNRATQAHHLTYKHVFNEPLFELIAVCRPCHEKITRLDREARSA